MSKAIRKTRIYQGLDKYQIYKEDTDNSIFQVFSIPNVLPKGKSHFLIYGSNLLKKETTLKVEILDADRNVVYTEIPQYLEANSRAVSIWVYSDHAVGIGKITILGELKDAPNEWKNNYNVRWTKDILINPERDNDLPIKFVSNPTYNIKETLKFNSNYNTNDLELLTFNSGNISGHRYGWNNLFLAPPYRIPDIVNVNDLEYIELNLSGSTFNHDLLNAQIYIDSPNFIFPYSSSWDLETHYTGTITYIHNENIAIATPPLYVTDNFSGIEYPVQFNFSNYEIRYISKSVGTATVQTSSFLELDFNNLTTFSGKVNSARIWKKSRTSFNTYTPLGDYILDTNNMLVDENTTYLDPIGEFKSLDSIQTYWETGSYSNIYPSPIIEYNDSHLFGSVKLYNSKYYSFYPKLNLNFHKDNNYVVSFIASTKVTESLSSQLEVYASGSAFNNNNLVSDSDILLTTGKLITTLTSSIDTDYTRQDYVFTADSEASGTIVFAIKQGIWYIRDIYVYPYSDDGFNPDSTKVYVPNLSTKRNEAISIKVEFLNSAGKAASDTKPVINPFTSTLVPSGSPVFIEGLDNVLTGSLVVGDSTYHGIEIAGQHDAFVRSIGYGGFYNAENFGQAGFIIYSGSILSGSNDNYNGVGLELHAGYNSGSLKFVANATESYLRISGSIYATDGYFSGILSASEGYIGGWEILSDKLLSSTNKMMLSGSGVISSSKFYVSEDGNVTASSGYFQGEIISETGSISGWILNPGYLSDINNKFKIQVSGSNYILSSSNFQVDILGNLTASNVSLSGSISASSGYIGGWEIVGSALSGSNITLDANGSRLYKTDDVSNYFIDFTPTGSDQVGTGYYVRFGPNFAISHDGTLIASGAVIEGSITASTGLIGGWSIGTSSLYKDDGLGKIVGLGTSGSNDDSPRFWAGADILTYTSAQNAPFNVKANGDITGSNVLFTGGKIGGWGITNTVITSSNIVINSNGSIYTSDYESNNKGWIITSALNGYAEFQNVKVRGTLSTTVFEKDTINSIGGQLWVANSTTLSQSVSSTEVTWSVKNASGFEANEILLTKTLNNTGFSTEYVLVQSSSITNTNTGEGYLYVERAYASGTSIPPNNSPYIDFTASNATDYSASQVIVSTGKLNSGYIRINANPNDTTTPYIDIIERTGSGIYDLDLVDRVGDLSGLSSNLLYGDTNPGLGIYTKNGYFTGAVTARTGSFTGIVHVGSFNIGLNVSGSNNGIYLNRNNYWYDDGNSFKIGDDIHYVVWNGSTVTVSGDINIIGGNAATTSSVINAETTASNYSASLASDLNSVSSSLNNTIYSVSSSLSSSITSRIVTDSNNLIIKTNDAPSGQGLYLSSNYMGYYDSTNWNAYVSSSGEFLFEKDTNNKLSFANNSFILNVTDQATISGSSINLVTPKFYFGSDTQYISGSSGNIEISSSNFYLDNSGNVTTNGTIYSTNGGFGGTPSDPDILIGNGGIYINDSQSIARVYIDSSGSWRTPTSGSNVVLNPGFETGDLTYWTGSTGTVTISGAGVAHTGTWAGKLASGGDAIYQEIISGLIANTLYEFSFYVKQYNFYSYGGTFKIYKWNGASYDLVKTNSLSWGSSYTKFSTTYYNQDTNKIKIEFTTNAASSTYYTLVDDFSIRSQNFFTELNANGLYVWASPSNYIKLGRDSADFSISTMNTYDLNVNNNLAVSGGGTFNSSVYIHGDLTVLGNYYAAGADIAGTTSDNFILDSDGSGSYDNLQFTATSNYLRYDVASNLFELSSKLYVSGNINPSTDNSHSLGESSLRYSDIFAVQTTTGGIFETGLKTQYIGNLPTGTIVIWENGKLKESYKSEDYRVIGVIKNGKDEPIILGAEYILVTGKINEGDYIVTSNKKGHGIAVKQYLLLNKFIKRNIHGKIIGQALESCNNNESTLIKAFIGKI